MTITTDNNPAAAAAVKRRSRPLNVVGPYPVWPHNRGP